MSNTKNSFSSLIAQFLRLQKNSLEIITKLNEILTSNKDSINIEFLMDDNTSKNIQVPSYGFLKSEINRLDQNIQTLIGLKDSTANIRNEDGSVSKIFQVNFLKDPDYPSNLSLPITFNAKNNWFFESFLNPLLYISLDLEGKIPDDSDRVLVKRIIANTQTETQKEYFDKNLKGRNDISDKDFISILESQGINYFIDEEIKELELRNIRFKGSFGVIKIFDEEIEEVINNTKVKNIIRKYKLNTLKYTDILADSEYTRTLTEGDKLITQNGSKYEITSINSSEQTVTLKRIFGYEPINIGDNSLMIYSNIFSHKIVDINIGFDERQAIFIKSIDKNFNIASSKYSLGVCFWSNELKINTNEGIKTLEEFYHSQVADFGKIFINAAKENIIPSIYGLKPNAPVLHSDNFKVVQINKHITDTKENKNLKEKIQIKTSLKNEISAIDHSIEQVRKQLGDITTTSISNTPTIEYKKLNDKILTLTKEKEIKTNLLSTTIADINNLINITPELISKPKYRVRGFWAIPNPVNDSKSGYQHVIQFNIRYRYISSVGSTNSITEYEYIDNDGNKKNAHFSNWIEIKSKVREKYYDENAGVYKWKTEDVNDANVVNINQLDIPINKGEKVEIQVQSISESGWPHNPLVSDWSNSVIIEFPPELSSQIENEFLIKQNISDNTIIQLKSELQAQGLEQHFSTSFTSADRYFAHNANSIFSGFYDLSGKSLDLFQKLTQIDNEINSLRSLLTKEKGKLGVYIRDKNNLIKVNNGNTINLFAGYYDELIDLSNPNNKGKIATVIYYLEIRNESSSPLELSSLIPGGQKVHAPYSTNDQDYNLNRKYGHTPICLSSINENIHINLMGEEAFIQPQNYQSGNAYSQFIYTRYKSVGLEEDLYFEAPPITSMSNTIPVGPNGILVPFDPINSTPVGAGDHSEIWNGTYDSTTGKPNGNGKLNEFSIHISHPELKDNKTYDMLCKPQPQGTIMIYPAFRHTLGFETDTNTVKFLNNNGQEIEGGVYPYQTSYVQQLQFTPPTSVDYGNDLDAYPSKLGFVNSDEFLCGKYSCGAYLFLSPINHTSIQVEGTTQLAKKILEYGQENAIVIPIIFQFRAQDKLGYVGGWRESGTLKNITYTKKIGIDIKVSNEELFSFDVIVSGSYTKTSLISPLYSQNVITTK